MGEDLPSLLNRENCYLDDLASGVSRPALVVGVVALATSLGLGLLEGDGLRHFLFSYLVTFCFFLSLVLGSLFFVLIQHLTAATWSVAVRRLMELVAANTPVVCLFALPLLLSLLAGNGDLYPWSNDELVASDHLLQLKRPYLNVSFFAIRCFIYFAVWSGIAWLYLHDSTQQDYTRDQRASQRMKSRSAPAILCFALTLNFAAFDFVMSLTPHWSSTLFGVYFFAGSLVGTMALLILIACALQGAGRLVHVITTEHYHDLGKLLFGFLFFWAYLAFSQYLLIWYANLPEETSWYAPRQTGAWRGVSVILLFGSFVLPFLGLLSRATKRDKLILCMWAGLLLVMHWLDIYWLVMPTFSPDQVPLSLQDVSLLIGLGGVLLWNTMRVARNLPLAPLGDPCLRESLLFHNV